MFKMEVILLLSSCVSWCLLPLLLKNKCLWRGRQYAEHTFFLPFAFYYLFFFSLVHALRPLNIWPSNLHSWAWLQLHLFHSLIWQCEAWMNTIRTYNHAHAHTHTPRCGHCNVNVNRPDAERRRWGHCDEWRLLGQVAGVAVYVCGTQLPEFKPL